MRVCVYDVYIYICVRLVGGPTVKTKIPAAKVPTNPSCRHPKSAAANARQRFSKRKTAQPSMAVKIPTLVGKHPKGHWAVMATFAKYLSEVPKVPGKCKWCNDRGCMECKLTQGESYLYSTQPCIAMGHAVAPCSVIHVSNSLKRDKPRPSSAYGVISPVEQVGHG